MALHVAMLLAAAISVRAAGLTVAWSTAEPAYWVSGAGLTIWLYLALAPGKRQREWLVAEGCLVFVLLLMFCVWIFPVQYAGAAWNRPTIDSLLASVDEALGFHVPSLVAWTRAHTDAARIFTVAYNSLAYQFLFLTPVLIILGARRALWEYAWHFHWCATATVLAFALFPAACAFNYYGFASTIDQSRFNEHFHAARAGRLSLLQFGQLEGLVSAPSFHVAGALIVTWVLRHRWWWLASIGVLNGALIVATFMTGTHYVIDAGLSAALFAVSVWSWRRFGVHLLDDVAKGAPTRQD